MSYAVEIQDYSHLSQVCQQHTNAVIHNMHVPFILHKKIKYCFKWAQIKQMPPHFENK